MPAKPKISPAEIESLYDSGQYRITQERNDFLLPQILDFVREKKWMNLRPEYQRRLVWDKKKKSLFIESLLMNIPVPPVFLYETDLSRYEVMDGQQRLNSILEFYDNSLKLTGLETWKDLNGLTYKDCPPRIKSGFDRRRISANVLLAESASTKEQVNFIRKTVFERLNTGGTELNAQELRNSLYSGPFNDLIVRLAGYKTFNKIWDIPPYESHYKPKEGYISKQLSENKIFSRMIDCEIILRFFALRESDLIKGSMKSILDKCMEKNRDLSENKISELGTTFETTLETAYTIFGEHTFRVKDDKGNWKLSQPLFDAVMVSLEKLSQHSAKLIRNKAKITKDLAAKLKDETIYETIVGKPNTAISIKDRIEVLTDIFKKNTQ